jgi:hypothetical protein
MLMSIIQNLPETFTRRMGYFNTTSQMWLLVTFSFTFAIYVHSEMKSQVYTVQQDAAI